MYDSTSHSRKNWINSATLLRETKSHVTSKTYFGLFRHDKQYLLHWASNETATIEILSDVSQKMWWYIVERLKQQLQSINLHKTA